MHVAGFAALLLVIVLVAHVALWRVRLPKAHTKTLLILFLGALPAALLANALAPPDFPLRLSGFWEYAQVGLFHVVMSLAYIEFYTSVEEESPTITLVMFVRQAGDQGRSEEELYGLIDDQYIVGGRLDAMLRGGFVEEMDGRYRLTRRGRRWATRLAWARRLYHLQLGG